MYIDNKAREQSAMGRFEIMCERYINGSNRDREIILSFLTEDEKQTFLLGCGLYHLFTDKQFYEETRSSIGDQIYRDLRSMEC